MRELSQPYCACVNNKMLHVLTRDGYAHHRPENENSKMLKRGSWLVIFYFRRYRKWGVSRMSGDDGLSAKCTGTRRHVMPRDIITG